MPLRPNVASALKLTIDTVAWGFVAAMLAFCLRLEFLGHEYFRDALTYALVVLPLKVYALVRFGLNRQGWRKVSTRDAGQVLRAVGVVTGILFVLGFWLQQVIYLPRSVPRIEGLLAGSGLAGLRLLSRFWHERAHTIA